MPLLHGTVHPATDAVPALAIVALCVACSASAPSRAFRWHQIVSVNPDLSTLDVTLCTDGGAPEWLLPPYNIATARSALLAPRALPSGTPLPLDPHGIPWPHHGSGCVRFGVDLAVATRQHPVARHTPGLVVLPVSTWLWRPDNAVGYPTDGAVTQLSLPPGMQSSAPWPTVGTDRPLDASALTWQGYLALGDFTHEIVRVKDTVFDVAHLGDRPPVPVTRWLSQAVDAVHALVGRFPSPSVQILLVPGDTPGREPVDFGLTCRGGGAAVIFVIDPGATEASLARDWVATHEFIHLAHPVLDDPDAWLGEGIATYYQEVLRARTGNQTAAEAWGALAEGLRRGSVSRGTGTLAEQTATMHQTHDYTRVYWSGVAIALRVDVSLREHSGNTLSLDTLVRALATASAHDPPGTAWSATEVATVFDRASGTPVWSTEAARWAPSSAFPSYAPVLESLGVHGESAGVTLDPSAPLASIREAITARAAFTQVPNVSSHGSADP